MKKTGLLLVFSFLTLFSLGSLAMVSYQPELKKQLIENYTSLFNDSEHDKNHESTELPVLEEEIFIAPELKIFKGRLKKDAYSQHLQAAESNGVGLILDQDQLRSLTERRELVEATTGDGYTVEKLTHSYPYITPESKKVLEELGKTFEALAGKDHYFTVSSGTRTVDQQKKLKRRNSNATAGNSSHSYGVSFDISYIRFNGKKEFNYTAQKQLEAVLDYFQKEEKIYVIKERKQNCFHVTVR